MGSTGRINLFGQQLSKKELLNHVGDISQVADIRLFEFTNGNERGVRAAEFYTGSGFTFTVLLDRGMDIDDTQFRGVPIAWQSQTGPVSPAFYDPRGIELVRQFQGGLLMGCGPTYVGVPTNDQGAELGLHGRLSNIPAKDVSIRKEWQGNDYVMSVEGSMFEGGLWVDSVRVSRRIETRLGASRLTIHDVVENVGFQRAHFAILYHFQVGWPVLTPDSRLHIKSQVKGSPLTKVDMDKWNTFQEPTEGYGEQLFVHTVEADADGMANAAVINPGFDGEGLGIYFRWNQDVLPLMNEWKAMNPKAYVIGLQPTNGTSEGRAADREAGILQFLEPDETAEIEMEVGLLTSKAEIDSWLRRNG